MTLKRRLEELLKKRIYDLYGIEVPVQFEKPKNEKYGDYSTGVAFQISKNLGQSPQEIAETLKDVFLDELKTTVERVDVVAGFINIFLRNPFLQGIVRALQTEVDTFTKTGLGRGKKVLLEFVSANPTGPLNVVNARAAAFGDSLANVMREVGFEVTTEYYVNDRGGQIDALGESVAWRQGLVENPPEDGYLGDYLIEIAEKLRGTRREELGAKAADLILDSQLKTLERFRVKFDVVTKESKIRESGYPKLVLEKLEPYTYVEEGALYLRTTLFGDEKDRVLIRKNGEPTYFFYDIAYHLDKRERGHELLIDIWGPDHMGHVERMKIALELMGLGKDILDVIIVQQVNLLKGGRKVKMSKRRGEFYTMDELIDEVGVDAARFFFVMRSASSHLDFDIDLAKKMETENPVYYVQYVHARVRSLVDYARDKDLLAEEGNVNLLELPEERTIMREILYFPDMLEEAATKYSIHLIPQYLLEISRLFHNYYQKIRIVSDNKALSGARLSLALAVGNIVRKGLNLIGVSAPERM